MRAKYRITITAVSSGETYENFHATLDARTTMEGACMLREAIELDSDLATNYGLDVSTAKEG